MFNFATNNTFSQTGNFLGDLTNKLEKPNCSNICMSEFYSTGPKCYLYLTHDDEYLNPETYEIKIKCDEVTHANGFLLRGNAKKKINLTAL